MTAGEGRKTMAKKSLVWGAIAFAAGCALAVIFTRQNELLRESRQGILGESVYSKNACSSESSHSSSKDGISTQGVDIPLICKHIGDGRSPSSIWRDHTSAIFEAAMHPRDTGRIHQNWTRELLRLVTPEILEGGLRTSPSYKDMTRIMGIIDSRMRNASAPPLNVAIFGGSVTEGVKCGDLPVEILDLLPTQEGGGIRGRECPWPFRLQVFADHFFGSGVIRIYNLAAGGTDSNQAKPVMNYRLYPKGTPLREQGPDVVVNAYSTNDNHHSWKADANASADYTHFNNCFRKAQHFLDTALRSRPCLEPPLVVFVDEYFGNAHELVLGEEIRHEAVQTVMELADSSYISSAFTAKHFVRANTNETIFSPSWFYHKRVKGTTSKKRTLQRNRDAHFGMPGHVHVTLVVVYSLLKAAVEFCDDMPFHDTDLQSMFVSQSAQSILQSQIAPIVTSNTTWATVASEWRASEMVRASEEQDFCKSAAPNENPCPFAFIATPAGTAPNAGKLNNYIRPFIASNSGWSAKNDLRNGGWQNKVGLVADGSHPNATIEFKMENIDNRIRQFTLHSLKSYGEMWAGSEAEFNITVWKQQEIEHETSFRVTGYHNQNTSISYPYQLDLGEKAAAPGRTVTLKITLVGGTIFKIISLMLCSR